MELFHYSANTEYSEAKFIILGSNIECSTDQTNCSDSADIIRKYSSELESFSIYSKKDLQNSRIYDAGNIDDDSILLKINNIIKDNKIPIVIGGSHASTIHYAQQLDCNYVVIDAHSDYYQEFNNNSLSHACVSRRLAESGKVAIMGMRDISLTHWNEINKSDNIITFDVQAITSSVDSCCSALKKWNKIWLSIDLDGIDPSQCPSVGTPVPNGLSVQQVLQIITILNKNNIIVGIDINELQTTGDSDAIRTTSLIANSLLKEFILTRSV